MKSNSYNISSADGLTRITGPITQGDGTVLQGDPSKPPKAFIISNTTDNTSISVSLQYKNAGDYFYFLKKTLLGPGQTIFLNDFFYDFENNGLYIQAHTETTVASTLTLTTIWN